MAFKYKNKRKKSGVKIRTKAGRFGPVQIDVKKKSLSFREKKWKIEFSKSDIVRWTKGSVRRLVFATVLFVIALFVFVATPGSARIATFYPETCLGGWENPSLAEGQPDILPGARNAVFSSTNSAMNRDVAADIFCGNFKGAIPEDGTMRTAVLSFSLYVGDVVQQKDGTFFAKDLQGDIKVTKPIKKDANLLKNAMSSATSSGAVASSSEETNVSSEDATVISGSLIDNFYEILDAPQGSEVRLTNATTTDKTNESTKPTNQQTNEPTNTDESTDQQTGNTTTTEKTTDAPKEKVVEPPVETLSVPEDVTSPPAPPEPTADTPPISQEAPQDSPVSWLRDVWQAITMRGNVVYATTTDTAGATNEPTQSADQQTDMIEPTNQPTDESTQPTSQQIDGTTTTDRTDATTTVVDVSATTTKATVSDVVVKSATQDEPLSTSTTTSISEGDSLKSKTMELFDEQLGVPKEKALVDASVREITDIASTTLSITASTSAVDTTQVDAPTQDQDTLFTVEYSFNGTDWVSLGEVTARNWQTVSFELPFVSWESIGNMQVRLVKPMSFDKQPAIMLDAMTLKVSYAKDKADRNLLQKHSDIQSFQTTEDPSFEFAYHIKKENRLKSLVNNIAPVFPLDRDFSVVKAEVDDVSGKTQEVGTELDLGANDTWKVVIPKDARTLRPGKYIFDVTTANADGETFVEQKEFYWGVLTINTNKSIYEPNEDATIQMGALDSKGHTLCDASLELEIQNPKKESTFFNVEDDSILMSGVCSGDTVVDLPDYSAHYKVGEAGTYQMRLINHDTGFEILDSFEVQEHVPFVVERFGPTRIFPPATYEMNIKVTAQQDFNGDIYEYVPSGFVVSDVATTSNVIGAAMTTDEQIATDQQIDGTTTTDRTDATTIVNGATADVGSAITTTSESSVIFAGESVSDEPDTKELLWKASLKTGESVTLRYVFDAPDISPKVFLLGPLQFYE